MDAFPRMEFNADVDSMSPEELKDYLSFLEDCRADMDGDEPDDETSDEFVDWAERHEALEDLYDEVAERLELLEGRE